MEFEAIKSLYDDLARAARAFDVEKLSEAARVVCGCALVVCGARVRFRLQSGAVPITGQTACVSLASWTLGRVPATLGAVLYVALALAGAPVLAGWRRGAQPRAASFKRRYIRLETVLPQVSTSNRSATFSALSRAPISPRRRTPRPRSWWCSLVRRSAESNLFSSFSKTRRPDLRSHRIKSRQNRTQTLGQLATVATGAAWLVAHGTSPATAWTRGVRPFLPGLLLKSLFVSVTVAVLRAHAVSATVAAWGARFKLGAEL